MTEPEFYQPSAGGVESLPTRLNMFHASPRVMQSPHWHAQVEVNFIVRGWAHYRMSGHDLTLSAGELALFWGGLPHQLDAASDDLLYAGGHLPLVHFFCLKLPGHVPHRLMQGATLKTSTTDASDPINFARWFAYAESGNPLKAQLAVGELLLRLERIRFDPYELISCTATDTPGDSRHDPHASRIVVRICAFIADNFREEIDSGDIAAVADIHPKYAMSVFKKCTGMTLNEYVSLMRLSYAQALLLRGVPNILDVALESGFGSLSNFNKCFRRIAGMSPTDFRRDSHVLPELGTAQTTLAH